MTFSTISNRSCNNLVVLDLNNMETYDILTELQNKINSMDKNGYILIKIDEENKFVIEDYLSNSPFIYEEDIPYSGYIKLSYKKQADLSPSDTQEVTRRRRASTAVPLHANNPGYSKRNSCLIM